MLLCMQRIIDKQKAVDTAQASLVSFQSPGYRCEVRLGNKIGSATSGKLFDQFCTWWRRNARVSGPDRCYKFAKLQMFHPEGPTETPALEYLREWGESGAVHGPKQSAHFNQFLQRAHDIALLNSNQKDAAWIEKTFRHRLDIKTDRFSPLTQRDVVERQRTGIGKKTAGQAAFEPEKRFTPPTRRDVPIRQSDRPTRSAQSQQRQTGEPSLFRYTS